MPFIVRDTKTGMFAKVGRRSYYRKWVKDMNDATVYRNMSAVKNSVGVSVKNLNRQLAHEELKNYAEAMTKLYGPNEIYLAPLRGIFEVSRETGEEKTINSGWPENVRQEYHRLSTRASREPFGHMHIPGHLEVLQISFEKLVSKS